MKTIIVDNEQNVIDGLREMIADHCPELKIIGTAGAVVDAKKMIEERRIDLLLLDIELNDGTGLELLEQIEGKDFQVIFITAFNKYAIEAFKYSSIDFLLKPVDIDDLVMAVQKAKKAQERFHNRLRLEALISNMSGLSMQNKKLIVSDRDNFHALPINDIQYLEADGAYTTFHLSAKRILSSRNLKTFEAILTNANFFRTHHSFLVNLSHMERYDKFENVLVLQNGQHIPVSSRKKEALLERFRDFSIL